MKNKRIGAIIISIVLILSIPLIAGWPWTLGDFLIAGILLFGTGFIFELIMQKVKKGKHRIMLASGLFFLLVLIWADLAVGIFNIPGFSGN